MKAFKIILGIIIMAIGLGIAAAGCALFAYGNLSAASSMLGQGWITTIFAMTLALFGIATIVSAWTIIRGARVCDVLENVFRGMP